MEKYELSDTDYQRYDRIWQRVAPNLNPYPDVRAAQTSEAPQPDALPEETSSDPCCMGSAAQHECKVLYGFISTERQHAQLYHALMRNAAEGEPRRLWHDLYTDAVQHARRQMAACYLITAQRFSPAPSGDSAPTGYPDVLRCSYHAEACLGMNYIRAADETTDPCLAGLWRQLSRESYDHAERILQFLAKRM